MVDLTVMGPIPPVLVSLRTATGEIHRAVERLTPFFRPDFDRDGYLKWLHLMQGFYGVAEQGWFDTFYIDKDLIVSPNASGQIFKGSFDGFPTASVTDAAMRKVAMMVTDPMGLNDDNFEDGKDVLITSNDPTELVANLEFLLDNPSFLTSIAEAGYKKANYLYSVEKQIHPRIEILKNCLAEIEFNQQSEKVDNPRNGFQIEGNEGIHAPLEATGASFQSILYNFIRRMTPRSIKRAIRKVMRVWVIIRGL